MACSSGTDVVWWMYEVWGAMGQTGPNLTDLWKVPQNSCREGTALKVESQYWQCSWLMPCCHWLLHSDWTHVPPQLVHGSHESVLHKVISSQLPVPDHIPRFPWTFTCLLLPWKSWWLLGIWGECAPSNIVPPCIATHTYNFWFI